MLDVGWSEMLVIAIVMIVVVGPKDLPKMLRTFGRMTTKMRGMANDFQRQFNEAIKEAELDDVKKSVDSLRSLNPAAEIRKQLNPFEKAAADVRSSIDDAGKLKATPVPEVAPAASDAPFPAMTDASVPPEQTSVAAAPAAKKAAAAKAVKAPVAKKAAAPKAPPAKKAEAPKAPAPKAVAPKLAAPKPAKTDAAAPKTAAAAPKTAAAAKPAAAKSRTRTASKTTRTPK